MGFLDPVRPSKSFVQSFAEALRDELRDTAITVTALMPGPADTNFFGRTKMTESLMGKMPKDDPALVARQGGLRVVPIHGRGEPFPARHGQGDRQPHPGAAA
jgi:NAD(P)-dependent dehydrogenase (short-subunit alcohol dehydrogenase family)